MPEYSEVTVMIDHENIMIACLDFFSNFRTIIFNIVIGYGDILGGALRSNDVNVMEQNAVFFFVFFFTVCEIPGASKEDHLLLIFC